MLIGAEWSERSVGNAGEESRKLHQGSLVRFLDSATPSTLQQSAGLRSARNDTRFFQTVTLFCDPQYRRAITMRYIRPALFRRALPFILRSQTCSEGKPSMVRWSETLGRWSDAAVFQTAIFPELQNEAGCADWSASESPEERTNNR